MQSKAIIVCIVFAVATANVLVETDWLVKPSINVGMSSIPASTPSTEVATRISAPTSATDVVRGNDTKQNRAAAPAASVNTDVALMSNAAVEANAVKKESAVPNTHMAQPKCDVVACSKAYHSFQESDCTYQPSGGPRRLCTKGTVANSAAVTTSNAGPIAPGSNGCNLNACSAAYQSFTASDCTYQPSNGPRRRCTK